MLNIQNTMYFNGDCSHMSAQTPIAQRLIFQKPHELLLSFSHRLDLEHLKMHKASAFVHFFSGVF